ncbi:phosphate acyltransferase PlsX [Larsenimonas rhizosphaerae]|uniref:Phosphate acyltransferase n=1 Tax=Larsenimonas rhizosphaerae TaxID=2944682 RepID=A0AA42CTV3_9GAMM|nr:phosphate acyltransferase PlsX [Larsenimonas rhizosphaerae]MCX2523669.1 phosphate acyltransferase PlsX [Larsenimonas rhizosphaerae]
MRIAVDAMGGDFGPRTTVRGVAQALAANAEYSATLFGPSDVLYPFLEALPASLRDARERMSLVHAEHVVGDDVRPSRVLRAPDTSSMHQCLLALSDGRAQACVSGGHTGALMALARHYIGMSAGLERPAISAAIPSERDGRCYMLDLGANVDSPPRNLAQFARMGAAMASIVDGLACPRVALLNVGVEPGRGERRVRDVDALLRSSPSSGFDYVGFVEGDAIFSGKVDVVVCDGAVGNVVLKSSEGLARMLGQRLQQTFEHSWRTRLVSLLARPALSRFREELDPVRYNGASFLGLAGTVVKSHGGADARGFSFAVRRAALEASQRLPERLSEWLVGE